LREEEHDIDSKRALFGCGDRQRTRALINVCM
jgi:hypothetical protein